MKTIEIAGKEYTLHYGLDFIREMDKRHSVDTGGLPLGMGVNAAVVYLQQGNPTILEDIILSATHTLKSIPSKENIEEWIETQEDLEVVFEDFLSALKTAPMTKTLTNKILTAMNEA